MEEKTYFTNSDGLKLCGILSKPQKKIQKCIILCHGITVTKDESGIFTELAKKLSDSGFAVFRFDFRGHGESEGSSIDLTVTGEKNDLESAVTFMKKQGYKIFGIVAASFGGGAVSLFTSEKREIIKAVVFWNAIIDYHSILKPKLPWPKKNFNKEAMEKLKKQGFIEVGSRKFKIGSKLFMELKEIEPWKGIKDLDLPTLFIHGDSDSYVPYEDSVKYSNLFKNSRLETIKGGEHGFQENKNNAMNVKKITTKFFLDNL